MILDNSCRANRFPMIFRISARGRPGGPESLALPGRAEVDPGEDHGQLRRQERDAVAGAGVGQLEGAGLEPLVPDRQAVVVEIEDLEAIPAAVDEEEEVTGQEVLAEAFLDQAREAVETLAHVDRSGAEERADGRGE